jgi:hypothetical protein
MLQVLRLAPITLSLWRANGSDFSWQGRPQFLRTVHGGQKTGQAKEPRFSVSITAALVPSLIPFSERALRPTLPRCGVRLRFPPSDTTHRYTCVLTATLSFTFALTATLCFKRDLPPMRTSADLKGIANAAVPLYASTRCHLMVQGTEFVTGPITPPEGPDRRRRRGRRLRRRSRVRSPQRKRPRRPPETRHRQHLGLRRGQRDRRKDRHRGPHRGPHQVPQPRPLVLIEIVLGAIGHYNGVFGE